MEIDSVITQRIDQSDVRDFVITSMLTHQSDSTDRVILLEKNGRYVRHATLTQSFARF